MKEAHRIPADLLSLVQPSTFINYHIFLLCKNTVKTKQFALAAGMGGDDANALNHSDKFDANMKIYPFIQAKSPTWKVFIDALNKSGNQHMVGFIKKELKILKRAKDPMDESNENPAEDDSDSLMSPSLNNNERGLPPYKIFEWLRNPTVLQVIVAVITSLLISSVACNVYQSTLVTNCEHGLETIYLQEPIAPNASAVNETRAMKKVEESTPNSTAVAVTTTTTSTTSSGSKNIRLLPITINNPEVLSGLQARPMNLTITCKSESPSGWRRYNPLNSDYVRALTLDSCFARGQREIKHFVSIFRNLAELFLITDGESGTMVKVCL